MVGASFPSALAIGSAVMMDASITTSPRTYVLPQVMSLRRKELTFAQVSCLRCGASRNQAAVVAEGGNMNNYQNQGYNGPPNMPMGSMGSNSYGGMPPGNQAYGNTGMGGPPGDFGGQQSFGPPSTYALPSGLGAPSPYMAGGYAQMASNGTGHGQAQGGFDSRAEQAFNQGNASATGGAPGYSNGGYGNAGNTGSYGGDASDVSLSFLNAGMSNLGFGERDDRRNQQGGAKSPQ